MSKSTPDNRLSPLSRRPGQIGTLVGVRLQTEQLNALDDWRRKQDDLPSRPEGIRRLVDKGLKAD